MVEREAPEVGDSATTADPGTRDRILAAGMDCMARYGRSKTTLGDVASAAGLSRATLYRYFADRRALFVAVRDYEHERDAAEFDARLAGVDDLESAVAVVAEVLAASAARYRVSEHLAAGDQGLATFVTTDRDGRRRRIAALLGPHVERAAAAGRLAGDTTAPEAREWLALVLAEIIGLTSMTTVDLRDPAAVGRWFARRCCGALLAER